VIKKRFNIGGKISQETYELGTDEAYPKIRGNILAAKFDACHRNYAFPSLKGGYRMVPVYGNSEPEQRCLAEYVSIRGDFS
jgi:hypothetical protein